MPHRPGPELTASLCMLLAVLGFSLYPLFMVAGSGEQSPMLINTGWRLGIAAGCLAYFALTSWSTVTDGAVLRHITRNLFTLRDRTTSCPRFRDKVASLAMPLALLNGCGYILYSFSIRYLDTAAATAVFEAWPMVMILLLTGLGESTRGTVTKGDMALIVMATAGAALVVLSQDNPETLGQSTWTTLLGAALAVLAAASAGTAAFSLIWSRAVSDSLPQQARERRDPDRTAVCLALMPLLVTSVLTAPATGAAALLTGEPRHWHTLYTGFAAGALTSTGASVLFLKANLLTRRPALNSLNYLTPVLALTWLAAASGINPDWGTQIAKPLHLAGGAALIILTNAAMGIRRSSPTNLAQEEKS